MSAGPLAGASGRTYCRNRKGGGGGGSERLGSIDGIRGNGGNLCLLPFCLCLTRLASRDLCRCDCSCACDIDQALTTASAAVACGETLEETDSRCHSRDDSASQWGAENRRRWRRRWIAAARNQERAETVLSKPWAPLLIDPERNQSERDEWKSDGQRDGRHEPAVTDRWIPDNEIRKASQGEEIHKQPGRVKTRTKAQQERARPRKKSSIK